MNKFFVTLLFFLIVTFVGCIKSPAVLLNAEKSHLIQAETELAKKTVVPPPTVASSEFRSRPDLILRAYAEAYPEKISSVVYTEGDWALEMHNGDLFYWANGKMLPQEKRAAQEEYRSQQIYPYSGKPRNPDLYTPERIEALRRMASREVRSAPQLPLEGSFMRTLLGIGNRVETEENIVKAVLFGKSVNVHVAIVPKLANIDEQVAKLAKTHTDVADFLTNIGDVGGYSWRTVAGTNRNSNHSYGLALDILPKNWKNKAMYWDWINDYNENWMLLPQNKLWTPPEVVIDVFKNNGFIWGGTWDIYDTMHFEYRPELITLSKKIIF